MSTPDNTPPDFVAAGAAELEPVRFDWKLDNDTLRDINRAIGLANATHGRGFLGRLMLLWLHLDPASRPRLEIPEMRHDDLVFVPSPCYIVAIAADRRRICCWYSVLVDAQPSELLANRRGVWVFEAQGDRVLLEKYLECLVKTFRLRARQEAEGFTFYRMV